ncbi:MAG: hypothetical protein HPY50_18800 [Firmicutes bacterium]|nr:hypothetical protein [Bacillota bacterium]
MAKKKLNFWRLALTFTAVTIAAVLWVNGPNRGVVSGMDASMGNMMKKEHALGIRISDLFGPAEESPQMDQMHEHHTSQGQLIVSTHVLTTAAVMLMLPLVVAGSVFLAVVWIK